MTPALVTSDLDALRRQLDRLLPTAPGLRPGVGALLAAAAAAPDGSDIYLVTDRAPTDTERHLQLLRRLADSGTRVGGTPRAPDTASLWSVDNLPSYSSLLLFF